ncbi:MAG TPA: MerR family transcriptional regulator [Acidobacteriaceae bacterium]
MVKQVSSKPGSSLPESIPDKLYFRIGEVAELCGVETYVLRFWQTEFPQLHPNKSGTGQRLYRRRDVAMALRIKRLLHEEGYTIAGARQVFVAEGVASRRTARLRAQSELPLAPLPPVDASAAEARQAQDRAADRAAARLARLRLELRELHGILSQPPPTVPTRRATLTALPPKSTGDTGLFEDEPT